MAFSKNDLRTAIIKVQLLLEKVARISPVNHADIKRKSIASYAMEHVVRPCNDLLCDIVLADKEQGLGLDDVGFDERVSTIEAYIIEVQRKLSECEPETPQRFY